MTELNIVQRLLSPLSLSGAHRVLVLGCGHRTVAAFTPVKVTDQEDRCANVR